MQCLMLEVEVSERTGLDFNCPELLPWRVIWGCRYSVWYVTLPLIYFAALNGWFCVKTLASAKQRRILVNWNINELFKLKSFMKKLLYFKITGENPVCTKNGAFFHVCIFSTRNQNRHVKSTGEKLLSLQSKEETSVAVSGWSLWKQFGVPNTKESKWKSCLCIAIYDELFCKDDRFSL